MSKFKKISSTKESTVMQHDDGHTIEIAHKSLSPKMRAELKRIPLHMDEGGDVPDVKPEAAPAIPQNAGIPTEGVPTNDQILADTDRTPAQENVAPQGIAPIPVAAAPSIPSALQDPYGMAQYGNEALGGIRQQQAGIQQEAQARGQLGEKQAIVEEQKIQDLQQLNQKQQIDTASLMKQQEHLMNDYQNQHIDSGRLYKNMGTGQKVATAIGLILGGYGGGANPALEFLNQQINNDIDSQKAEMGKSASLLDANFKQFGNMRAATDMTRANLLGISAAKLDEEAAKAMSPMAKAQALQASGKLKLEAAGLIRQVGAYQAAMSQASEGQNPTNKIRALGVAGIIKPEQEKELYKDLKEAQTLTKTRDNILSGFEKIAALNTVANRTMNPIQSKRQVDAIIGSIVPGLSKETAGRFTEQDAHYIEKLFSGVGESKDTQIQKRAALEKLISEKMNFPMLQAYGINPAQNARFGQGGEKKIQLGPIAK